MINALKLFLKQKKQYIPDLFQAKAHPKYRGYPHFDVSRCCNCGACARVCPVGAIGEDNTLDLGKCIFCNDCVVHCPKEARSFSNYLQTAATSREKLLVSPGLAIDSYRRRAMEMRREIVDIFGRSLKLRSVSAGGCNSCELELNATMNVNFDLGRFGIDFVASPRHADGIIISGPISVNMADALQRTFDAIPEPKVIILAGSCAISGGIFAEGNLDRTFFNNHPVDLYIPGCPPHPLSIATGILSWLKRK